MKSKTGVKSNGLYNHRLFNTYYGMVIRNRGMVCDRWANSINGIANFIEDVGSKPSDNHILVRINENMPYSKDNYQWATKRKVGYNITFLQPSFIKSSGVYKLTFDSGHFYIGSTINFEMRFKVYRNSLKKTYVENKKMNECAIRCNSATFEVIEEVLDLTILRHREDYYLKMYSDNPNIINRSKSAFSNKGIVWTEQERISISRSLKGIPHKKRKLNDCLL